MAQAKFVVVFENGEAKRTKTLCQAIKLGCQSVGASHIKTQREIKLLAFWFWLWHQHLTIKSGTHTANIRRLGV